MSGPALLFGIPAPLPLDAIPPALLPPMDAPDLLPLLKPKALESVFNESSAETTVFVVPCKFAAVNPPQAGNQGADGLTVFVVCAVGGVVAGFRNLRKTKTTKTAAASQ